MSRYQIEEIALDAGLNEGPDPLLNQLNLGDHQNHRLVSVVGPVYGNVGYIIWDTDPKKDLIEISQEEFKD